mmetsp:Transcript_69189/g.165904  ORF Transcript_69189/g.165904 Transcript_69189/m.165904 type:complete len:324 (+) Transcript_69189:361-1332(+)
MADIATEDFFDRQLQDPANAVCCDSGTPDPQWASISHGTYVSIGASGIHRSLGVKVSFVQSIRMDAWKPLHRRMMELGGNQRFQDFMRSQNIPEDMPIREKYSTKAAAWYRRYLRALAEEAELPAPLPEGVGHLPATDDAAPVAAVLDRVYADVPVLRDSSLLSITTNTSPSTSPRGSHSADSNKCSPREENAGRQKLRTQADGLEVSAGSSSTQSLKTVAHPAPKESSPPGTKFQAMEESDLLALPSFELDCRGFCRKIRQLMLLQDVKEPMSPAVLHGGRKGCRLEEQGSEYLLTGPKANLKKVPADCSGSLEGEESTARR